MELPKNITQIGEVGRDCKIYVEDYVVSYMKQLNRAARDKDIAVALFGKRREENGIAYYFVYGASKLDFLQREVRHLSQAQRQEIENLRRKYFIELAFVGYRLLDGEMIEGFHICEQDICRYISGYAQFYEKNDAMLAYMLDVREEAVPEQVDQEKYEEVKKRQEERRLAAEGHIRNPQMRQRSESDIPESPRMPVSMNLQKMRMTAVGVFALLCLLGIATFRDAEKHRDMQAVQSTNVDAQTGLKTSDQSASGSVQKDTLVMEDKLEQALRQENNVAETVETPQTQETIESKETQESTEETGAAQSQPEDASTENAQTASSEQPSEETSSSQAVSTGAVAYVIQPGDTLTAISMRQYGTDIRVADICNLNKISNPDDIKRGQVIMLPR